MPAAGRRCCRPSASSREGVTHISIAGAGTARGGRAQVTEARGAASPRAREIKGKMGGRKSLSETRPEVVAFSSQLLPIPYYLTNCHSKLPLLIVAMTEGAPRRICVLRLTAKVNCSTGAHML